VSLVAEIDEAFAGSPPDWLPAFAHDPVGSLTKLFTEEWFHGHLNAEDPDELLLDWADGFSEIGPAFGEALDGALADWIVMHWDSRSLWHAGSPGVTWHRALRVVALIDHKPAATAVLRERVGEADDVLGPMTRHAARDPLGWYWTVLAVTQGDDESLREKWWSFCNLAPGVAPFHGRIGLLGLRRIAGPDRGRFRESVAAGVLRLACALDQRVQDRALGQREAMQVARTAAVETRAAYPFPEAWAAVWDARADKLEERPREWLAAVFGAPRGDRPRRYAGLSLPKPDPDWFLRAGQIANLLRRHDAEAKKAATALLNEQRYYAERAGDASMLTKTLCQLSSALGPDDQRLAHEWADEAWAWERSNPFTWSTLVIALIAIGDFSTALARAAEGVERFPDDPVIATNLATALRRCGRLDDAGAVLRDAGDRFPSNANANSRELAKLVRAQSEHGVGTDDARDPVELMPGADPPAHESDAARILTEARLLLRLAALRPADERASRLDRAGALADAAVKAHPQDVEALMTEIEVLLDQSKPEDAAKLIASLPGYIAQRPPFQALRASGRLDEVRAAAPVKFEQSILIGIVDPWKQAGSEHAALSAGWPLTQLRATTAMYDGTDLGDAQDEAIRHLVEAISSDADRRAAGSGLPQRNRALRSWWLGEVQRLIPPLKATAGDVATYASLAPLLEEQSERLDAIDRQLIDAARFTA